MLEFLNRGFQEKWAPFERGTEFTYGDVGLRFQGL